jgi:hypothetical protein
MLTALTQKKRQPDRPWMAGGRSSELGAPSAPAREIVGGTPGFLQNRAQETVMGRIASNSGGAAERDSSSDANLAAAPAVLDAIAASDSFAVSRAHPRPPVWIPH